MIKKATGVYPVLALCLVTGAYLFFAALYALGPGLGRGPDEPAHFVYVQEIARHFRMPLLAHETVSTIETRASHEAHQPFLYYAMAAVPYRAAAALGADTDTIWRVVRLFTALFGGLWIFFLYKLASEFFGRRTWEAAFSATLPGLLSLPVYMGGVVSNDIPTAMFFTAALWLIIRTLRRESISVRDAVCIGIWGGLAMLSKAQGIFLIPTLIATACIISACHGWKDIRTVAVRAATAAAVMLAIGGVWFVRNMAVYGTPVVQSLRTPPQIWSPESVSVVLNQMFMHFWAPIWIVGKFLGLGIYLLLPAIFCGIVLMGLFLYLRKSHMQKGGGLLAHRYGAWCVLAMPLVIIVASLVYLTLSVDFGLLQGGRLILPGAGGLGIATTAAIKAFAKRTAARRTLGTLLVLGLIAANLLVLALTAYSYSVS